MTVDMMLIFGEPVVVLTAARRILLSGTPATILMAPVAILAAVALKGAAHAFGTAVAVAASTGFEMPVSNSAVKFVRGPRNSVRGTSSSGGRCGF